MIWNARPMPRANRQGHRVGARAAGNQGTAQHRAAQAALFYADGSTRAARTRLPVRFQIHDLAADQSGANGGQESSPTTQQALAGTAGLASRPHSKAPGEQGITEGMGWLAPKHLVNWWGDAAQVVVVHREGRHGINDTREYHNRRTSQGHGAVGQGPGPLSPQPGSQLARAEDRPGAAAGHREYRMPPAVGTPALRSEAHSRALDTQTREAPGSRRNTTTRAHAPRHRYRRVGRDFRPSTAWHSTEIRHGLSTLRCAAELRFKHTRLVTY